MKFSEDSLFDLFEEEDLINIQLENFRIKTLIDPPLASIRPFSLITQKDEDSDYELTNFKLKDIFTTSSGLTSKISRTALGNLPESPSIERSEALPFLKNYLKEMGADNPAGMLKALRIYEEVKIKFYNLRREEATYDQDFVQTLSPKIKHPIIQTLKRGENVYVAQEVGKFSSFRLDLKDVGEDSIEDSGGTVRVSLQNNKRIRFSSRKRASIGFNLRQLHLQGGVIIITDPDKDPNGGGAGNPVLGPSGSGGGTGQGT